MENDPELDGKYLGTITRDFVRVARILQEASYQMRVRQISQYPIFPVARQEVPLGQRLMGPEMAGLEWYYHLSFLEEFVARKLIERPGHFQEAYKNPEEFCCLFVLDQMQGFTNFVFIPFPEDD
ncbi:MAG: hypothetical protein HC913_05900 [Microscillaceae bacterium]|nr:hypothetical protein [Microscillaceae bacterium]